MRMIYDTRQPAPRSRQEAQERFAAAWRRAESLIAGRKEASGFLAKWEALSPEAKEAVNLGARYEWGDDFEVGEVLSRATYGWDGYDNNAFRAEALIPLLQWYEMHGKEFANNAKSEHGPKIDYLVDEMNKVSDAQDKASFSGIRTLLSHLGH